jgi:hypothetical protein
MKQLLSIVVLCSLLVQWGSAQSRALSTFNYDLTTSVDPYVDLSGATSINNGELWDQPTYIVPMGFPFELNGHAVTSFHFNGSGSIMASNTTVPFVVAEVFPFESDLIDRGALGSTSLSPISYTIDGTPGNRIQKIEFKNAGSYYEKDVQGTLTMFVNFQCWLFEGSNNIEFHFGPSSIDNPLLFYGGGNGPESGLTDYDEFDNLYMNGHFLIGSASNPFLSEDLGFINGTPSTGTVYRLSYIAPLNITITGIDGTSFCHPNGSISVTVTGGILPYTFAWNTGATTSSIDSLEAGIYYVTVEDANGSTAIDSVTIVNAATMIINITSTDETSVGANDGTAAVITSGGTSPYTYAWSNGSTDALITNLSPGIYSVTVTDDSQCTVSQEITIAAYACGTLSAQVYQDVCFQSCYGIIILEFPTGVSPVSYVWSNGDSIPTLELLCAGDYTVTVTDAAGCQLIETYTIVEPALLLTNAGATNETINLNDGTAWAAPSGGTPPYSYAWSNGSMDSLITNLVPGVYTVTASDAFGCDAIDSVAVNPFCTGSPESFIENHGCLDTCQWSISSFIVPESPGPFTYLWSTGDTVAVSLNALCPGNYGLTIVDQSTQCTYVQSFFILQPEAIVAVVDTVIHLTDSTTTAISISVISGPSPYYFSWYGPNGYVGDAEDLTGVAPGFYSVQIYNTFGNCGEIDSIEVLDQTVGLSPISGWDLEIYPNPAYDHVFIKPGNAIEYQIQLLTSDGQPLRLWKNTTILDVQDMATGLYILKFISGKNSLVKPLLILQ